MKFRSLVTGLLSLCCLGALSVSVVKIASAAKAMLAHDDSSGRIVSLRWSEEESFENHVFYKHSVHTGPGKPARRMLLTFAAGAQGPELDYSVFKHNSQRHASLACTDCHQRSDNSATPRFPGHKACISCHTGQFVTANVPMCVICHTDVNNSNPPLKSFPTKFNESFNVKFDHAQHMTGGARPASGCAACHSRAGGRAAALTIPAGIAAHNQCYSCHTPGSRSQAGREIASCGVCHDQKAFARTSTNARSYRYAFSHAKHGSGQRLACADCHTLTAGAAQSRQVSSPAPLEHFAATRGKTCLSCHNGNRSFGGDLAFKDCKRCHTAATFKMPQ